MMDGIVIAAIAYLWRKDIEDWLVKIGKRIKDDR